MSRTTATAVHAAAVVLVFWVAFSGGRAFGAVGDPGAHDHPAPSPAATPMPDMPGMSAEEHAAMGHAGHDAGTGATTTDAGVSGTTRAAVLGGFGAANLAVVGTAFVLRRRGTTGNPRSRRPLSGRSRPRFAR
jgi:hypothetical protein